MNLMRKAAPLGWFFMSLLCLAVALIGAVAWFFVAIPDASDLDKCITAQMYEVPLCKAGANYVQLNSISAYVRNAVIVSEDSAFWDHEGIDWVELRKSFETNIEKGRLARGGSTITQQLAKNVYLSSDKSLLRKIREAVIAIRIERRYDKNLILEKYLNVVEFDKGIYGVKQGARHYFGVSAASLSVAQSAWLAFLLPNPKKYSVSYHKNKLTPFAYRQMSEIINRLWRFKKISEDERNFAIREAKAFFGGISGESKELEEEFDNDEVEELNDFNFEDEARDAQPETLEVEPAPDANAENQPAE
jgi:monofunctional biosynthetic peptidoglycan transglycosylase